MTKERLEEIRKQDESAHRRVEYEYGKDHDFPCPTCELLAELDRKNAVVEAARVIVHSEFVSLSPGGKRLRALCEALQRHDEER